MQKRDVRFCAIAWQDNIERKKLLLESLIVGKMRQTTFTSEGKPKNSMLLIRKVLSKKA